MEVDAEDEEASKLCLHGDDRQDCGEWNRVRILKYMRS